MAGVYTNGLPLVSPGIPGAGTYNTVTGYELGAFDTARPQGAVPQSVAISVFQIAALAGSIALNTVTEAANAATVLTLAGRIVTSALTTAAGATYVITVTATGLATALSNIQVALSSGTNTVPGAVVQSVVPAAGSFVITLRNTGTAALNGTLIIAYQIAPN
jgi:hypothetical protein